MQLVEGWVALEKLTGESFRIKADLRAQMVAVEKALDAERALVERVERDATAGTEKHQQLLAERRGTSTTASPQLAGDGESLQKLRSKVATVTAKLRKWLELATETVEKGKVAKVHVLLQSELWKVAQKAMDD